MSETKSTKRLYIVTEDGAKRLVRAGSQAQALAHVVKPRFTVESAGVNEVVFLMSKGVAVEEAIVE